MLWHYTTATDLMGIIDSGQIKTADFGVEGDEQPVAWFSEEPLWEPTAAKTLEVEGLPPKSLDDLQAMLQHEILPVRIGVSTDRAPLSWKEIQQQSGMPDQIAKGLEAVALKVGASPEKWRASIVPVKLEEFQTIEFFNGTRWLRFDHAIELARL